MIPVDENKMNSEAVEESLLSEEQPEKTEDVQAIMDEFLTAGPASDPQEELSPAEGSPADSEPITDPSPAVAPKKKRSLSKGWKTALLILAVLALLGAAVAVTAEVQDRRYYELIHETYDVAVSQVYRDGTIKRTTLLAGQTLELEQPEELPGYTFLGWRDEAGGIRAAGTLTASKTESYTAAYSPAINMTEHRAYLFPREDGLFHLEQNTTRGDTARMISALLDEDFDLTKVESFADVPSDSEYLDAALTLKALGISKGNRFSPEADITRGELMELLAAFFPRTEKECSFPDLKPGDYYYEYYALAVEHGWISENTEAAADAYLTRGEFILLMNHILGRSESDEPELKYIGILPECAPGEEYYVALAEAAVSHEYENSKGERWTSGEAREQLPEGPMMIGLKLYFVDENGHFRKDTEYNGFLLGPDGVYTSGSEELDELVNAVIAEKMEPDMSREDLLRALFDYTVHSFSYLRRTYYTIGDRSYAPEAAQIMLSQHSGNCYNFAGTFCMLARAIGYDAGVYSGTVGRDCARHGWCEIIVDGEPLICDAELMFKNSRLDMYMKTYTQLHYWGYNRGPVKKK